LNNAYSKYYTPSEHLAVDEVTVLFKAQVTFKTIHTQDTQTFWDKKFINYDMPGYIYNMRDGQDMSNCRHDRNTCNCETIYNK
jgi:hypothetical protein